MPCPAGDHDSLEVVITLRDINRAGVKGSPVSLREVSGSVNLVEDEGTSDETGDTFQATLRLRAGSGSGRIGVCADGVSLGQIEIRSPDVEGDETGSECGLPTSGSSGVDTADTLDTECGFSAHRGAVVAAVNRWWDLDASGTVDNDDLLGWTLGEETVGGWDQHRNHTGSLGAKSVCGSVGKMAPAGDRAPRAESERPGLQQMSAAGLEAILGPSRDVVVLPNPSRHGQTQVIYRVPVLGEIRIEVYDVTGRHVSSMIPRTRQSSNIGLAVWDGRDNSGRAVAPGIYFMRLTVGTWSRAEKLILVR